MQWYFYHQCCQILAQHTANYCYMILLGTAVWINYLRGCAVAVYGQGTLVPLQDITADGICCTIKAVQSQRAKVAELVVELTLTQAEHTLLEVNHNKKCSGDHESGIFWGFCGWFHCVLQGKLHRASANVIGVSCIPWLGPAQLTLVLQRGSVCAWSLWLMLIIILVLLLARESLALVEILQGNWRHCPYSHTNPQETGSAISTGILRSSYTEASSFSK